MPGGWGLEGAEVLGSGGDPQGTGRTFGRSDGRTDGWKFPLFYRTSFPSGPLPKKGEGERG